MTQDTKKQFEKELIQYGLKNNYIEKEKDGTLKFVGSKNQKNKSVKPKNNLDIAMLLTDAILNEFEKGGKLDIPLDEHKYSFDLQDVIQDELEKITPIKMSKEYKIYNEDNELVAKGKLLEILQLLINLGYRIEENKNG